jgi:spore germination protein GerM
MSRHPSSRRRRTIAAALIAVAVASAAACGDDGNEPGTTTAAATAPATTAPPTSATTTETAPTMVVAVYFSDAQGELVREERQVPEGDPVAAALTELARGPVGEGLAPALPEGTRVLGLSERDDVVTVDFSAEFEENYPPGGAAAEFAILRPVVQSVSEASGGKDVAITVEGRVPAPTGSQFDWTQPFSPDDTGG